MKQRARETFSMRKTAAYGLWECRLQRDGREFTGSGISERAAYLHALDRARATEQTRQQEQAR